MITGEKKTSEAIKELRQYLGLSLRLFGKPLGYSGTQIMRFENELTEPTDTVIEMICDAYGVDPRYFDGGVAIENAVQRVTKEENNRTVGKRLKLARNAKGLSMKELYYSSGVSDSQICLIENGENALTERTAEKLGQVLGVGVEWLLTGNEERKNQLALQQKQKDVDEARELAKNGIPIEHIAKMLHHTYRTIQGYLDPDYSVVNGHYNVRIPNKLAPFEEKVIMLRSQGMTYPKIHEIISKEGYNGSVASLRMFMQKEQLRRINEQEVNSDYQPVEFVQRKALTQLIYKSIDQVFTISKEQYNQVLKSYPLIAELYDVIQDFYRIINLKREDRLEEWLKKLEQFDIAELQTYVNGVRKDLDAVKNGIKYEYNNGLAEGSVNKIKVIKRTMYGRNSFQLLKAKVLLHEKFRFSIN